MKQTSNNEQNMADNKQANKTKHAYNPPHLVMYGNIAKFTQGSAGAKGDGGGGSKRQ